VSSRLIRGWRWKIDSLLDGGEGEQGGIVELAHQVRAGRLEDAEALSGPGNERAAQVVDLFTGDSHAPARLNQRQLRHDQAFDSQVRRVPLDDVMRHAMNVGPRRAGGISAITHACTDLRTPLNGCALDR